MRRPKTLTDAAIGGCRGLGGESARSRENVRRGGVDKLVTRFGSRSSSVDGLVARISGRGGSINVVARVSSRSSSVDIVARVGSRGGAIERPVGRLSRRGSDVGLIT